MTMLLSKRHQSIVTEVSCLMCPFLVFMFASHQKSNYAFPNRCSICINYFIPRSYFYIHVFKLANVFPCKALFEQDIFNHMYKQVCHMTRNSLFSHKWLFLIPQCKKYKIVFFHLNFPTRLKSVLVLRHQKV